LNIFAGNNHFMRQLDREVGRGWEEKISEKDILHFTKI
jgi:hypothetical protein